MKEGREQSKFKAAKAPHDIRVFEHALALKVNPETIRRHGPQVVAVAVLMEEDPDEVAKWDNRDRNWLLRLAEAQRHLSGDDSGGHR